MSQMDNGRLLLIKIRDIQRGNLLSKDWGKYIAKKLCKHINMTALAGPFTATIKDPDKPEDDGCSSTLIIKESNISIHAWSNLNECSIVIYSCKDFNVNKVKEFCEEEFFSDNIEICVNYKKGE